MPPAIIHLSPYDTLPGTYTFSVSFSPNDLSALAIAGDALHFTPQHLIAEAIRALTAAAVSYSENHPHPQP